MTLFSGRRRLAPAALATSCLALLVAVMPVVWPAAAEVVPPDEVTVRPADPLLAEPMRGERAIEQLGAELPVSAARSDLRPAELRSLLSEDRTAWVDEQGAVRFVEPARAIGAADLQLPAAQAPLVDTFTLHSNPGASKKIYLDFDGAEVAGTAWNAGGLTAGFHPGWDPTGDGAAFNDAERAMVQQVWAMVAEDYAPFDVDVTTQDPGADGLVRASPDDPAYGTRVLVSPSVDASAWLCPTGCGGLAYLGSYGEVGGYYEPAWVFPQGAGNSPKGIAEAASHEAGHTLGLDHDGTALADYYGGHGVWAPIMGVGYYRPLSQWSAGSYPGAGNQQDDVRTITDHLGARPDEASDSIALPSALPTGASLIGSRTDVDAFDLGRCTADSSVEVDPAALAPDLDVRAVLHDATGAQRAVSEPASGVGDGTTAAGLDAVLTVPTAGDGWVLTVEGGGQGGWTSSGYDDYGSLGAYTVAAPGCSGGSPDGAPAAPESVATGATATDSLTLSWSPPSTAGSDEISGYVVARSGSPSAVTLPATARSHTFTGLTPSTGYQLSVRAVNAAGAGPTVTVDARTAEPAPAPPSAPRTLVGSYVPATGKLQVWWAEPADPGTQPRTGYAVYLDGAPIGQLGPTSDGVAISRSGGFPPGQYVVGVAAVNAVGQSPVATVTITRVPPPPAPPTSVSARSGDNAATVTWAAPAGPVTSYRVSASPGGGACTTSGALTCTVTGLTNGTAYTFRVVATNSGGESATSAPSSAVVPAGLPGRVAAPTVVPGDGRVVASWPAVGGNGAPVTGYTVTASPGGRSCSTTALTCTVTGLGNGTAYTFTAVASNAVGRGVPSPASPAVTPVGRPGRVTPTVSVRHRTAVVSWKPAAPHGAEVERYLVDISLGRDRVVGGDAHSATFGRLKPGPYRVRVAAENVAGTAPQSDWVPFRVR